MMVCVVAVVALISCGGRKMTGEEAAETSMDAFIGLLFSSSVEPCTDGVSTSCSCPGGGTVTGSDTSYSYNNCNDASGNTFNGSVTLNNATDTIDANFPTFDECINVTSTGIPANDEDNCAGSISGTCAGEAVTCNLVDNAQGDCDCNF